MDEAKVVALTAVFTTTIAWVFRYKIAEIGKKRGRAPQEILFEGYEKLLKSYQQGLRERDEKIDELENQFKVLQQDLNGAHDMIRKMREEALERVRLITELETQLTKLKTTAALDSNDKK